MIILTVNSGSTSIKLAAFEAAPDGASSCIAHEQRAAGHVAPEQVLRDFLARLPDRPAAIAHRVVHGGTRFTRPQRIDATVLDSIRQLSELAPLHNPQAVEWIEAARAAVDPAVAQIAVFDTAFFATLPRVAAHYALPARFGDAEGVRRYGFHGLAHESLWQRWCVLYPGLPRGGRLITLQLGGGCSAAAIANGAPRDTSMGFSPLEGLVMATRSGDIDAAVVPYLQRRLSLTADSVIELLNRDSGVAGLAGSESDLGKLAADPAATSQFAVELYCYRARKYVGAYLSVLGGCDGIVFGGGVGEHVPAIRERILTGMGWAGIRLDLAANEAARGTEARIDAADGPLRVQVIRTDEEGILVRAALRAVLST
ncbi:MAG TPA: acetate/propionate family kinase [Steroidobacteraceae bacterium]